MIGTLTQEQMKSEILLLPVHDIIRSCVSNKLTLRLWMYKFIIVLDVHFKNNKNFITKVSNTRCNFIILNQQCPYRHIFFSREQWSSIESKIEKKITVILYIKSGTLLSKRFTTRFLIRNFAPPSPFWANPSLRAAIKSFYECCAH